MTAKQWICLAIAIFALVCAVIGTLVTRFGGSRTIDTGFLPGASPVRIEASAAGHRHLL